MPTLDELRSRDKEEVTGLVGTIFSDINPDFPHFIEPAFAHSPILSPSTDGMISKPLSLGNLEEVRLILIRIKLLKMILAQYR